MKAFRAYGVIVALVAGSCAPAARPSSQLKAAAPSCVTRAGQLDVEDYTLELEVRPETQKIRGRLTLTVAPAAAARSLTLAASDMVIEAVRGGLYTHDDGRLRIALPAGERRVEVEYQGRPTRGLHFRPDGFHTVFATEHWMPIHDLPGDKATFALTVTAPAGLELEATGTLRQREALSDGRQRWQFFLDRSYSAYLFGFVAARRLERHDARVGGVTLRSWSNQRSAVELERVTREFGGMLRFFETRAGIALPGGEYAHMFLDGGPVGQEYATFSVFDAGYVGELLAEPREDWLLAHELAHQWWGNSLTAARWADFWLNEGLATFLASAYKEARWGRDEYDRELALARRRYAKARESGVDRPLALPGDPPVSDVGGTLPYAKGSLVLHLLRYQLGDEAFFRGLREFTIGNAGCAVDTSQLQAAMERASGQSLDTFFAQWVRSGQLPVLVATHRLDHDGVVVEIEQRQATPWQLPLQIAVQTDSGRQQRQLWLSEVRTAFREPINAELRSVRVDAGGNLPFVILHERSVAMLMHQAQHEPDALGRAEAIERVGEVCRSPEPPAECAGLAAWLAARAAEDPARIVRSVALGVQL